jgi:hypothetical protein
MRTIKKSARHPVVETSRSEPRGDRHRTRRGFDADAHRILQQSRSAVGVCKTFHFIVEHVVPRRARASLSRDYMTSQASAICRYGANLKFNGGVRATALAGCLDIIGGAL